MKTAILFRPSEVKQVLDHLPSVAARLKDPEVEGVPSEAFPGELRKTHREVYRWISNTHYPHLAAVVPALERPHAEGCTFGSLLRTRSRDQFIGLTAELLIADDLLRRGYRVRTVERSGNGTPDLHVLGDGVDVAMEVYSPRELIAVDTWVREVSDLLSYIDVPASYQSSIQTTLPPDATTDPWAHARMLDRTRVAVMTGISRDVESALRDLRPLKNTYSHPGTPLVTTVELEDVRRPSEHGPTRQGSISRPGFSGYSPAGVFRKAVEKSLKKARRRQTHGVPAAARMLVVYIMGTQIAEDLNHPAHRAEAAKALDGIDPRTYSVDAMAFVVRAHDPERIAWLFTLFEDTKLTLPQVQAMFG